MSAEPEKDKLVQAIQLVANGMPMKQAAEEIGWNYQTLRNRLGQEYQSSGVNNVVHLAAIYFRLGLIR